MDIAQPRTVTGLERHLEFDLGNLCVFDPSPLDEISLRNDPDGTCAEVALLLAQPLLVKIFSLPTAPAPVGRLAQLPHPSTPIPRQKPLPKPRAPTKWEQFAQQKGIVKNKRSKLMYDEQQKEWRRRYGYKKANHQADIPIIEAKAGDQVGEDPFSQQRAEKSQSIKQQEKRQVANLKASAKQGAHPSTLRLTAVLPGTGKGRPTKRKDLADDIRAASRQAGVSTASQGKFDRRLPDERPGERAPAAKRRTFTPVTGSSQSERASTAGMVDKILRERSEELVDASRAVGQLQADKRAMRHQQHVADREDGPASRMRTGGRPSGKGRQPGRLSQGTSRGVQKGKGGQPGRKGKGTPAKGQTIGKGLNEGFKKGSKKGAAGKGRR